jgi:hypothetical protein
MLKLGLAALFALGIADAAFAQAPTDHVKIDVIFAICSPSAAGVGHNRTIEHFGGAIP